MTTAQYHEKKITDAIEAAAILMADIELHYERLNRHNDFKTPEVLAQIQAKFYQLTCSSQR